MRILGIDPGLATTGFAVLDVEGHVRGVIIMALHEHGVEVYEYTPSAMKRALTGDGRADKKAIQKMVKLELNLTDVPKPDDAADAVSLALTLAATLR